MKRILLPTDFSDTARNAINYALALFAEEACTFYVLHTYTPPIYRIDYVLGGPAFSAVPDAEVNRSLDGLEKTISEMKGISKNPDHRFEVISAFNILSHEINDISESKKIDLVVMGTKGATGAKEVFIGSNTVYVLRKATAPVLVIPSNTVFSPIKKILFPTDYQSEYKESEFQKILGLADRFEAAITVLHVKETLELAKEQIKHKEHLSHLLRNYEHEFVELQQDLMPYAVLTYLENESFGLLAMMNKKHNLLERILDRQNVDQLGYHIKIPFLVVRDTARVSKAEAASA
ncbi:universal stress protein [Muriicola sp. SD30]|uniref:universal stress protein n=1 Tax=Muriicola sp. SD30 TaxID=3240936 RepID=UPI003510B665